MFDYLRDFLDGLCGLPELIENLLQEIKDTVVKAFEDMIAILRSMRGREKHKVLYCQCVCLSFVRLDKLQWYTSGFK